MSEQSPFIPGARVAIHDRYGNGMTEAFVEKVYKTGNFTLRGSTQQWRSYSGGTAVETGGGWSRRHLEIWNEATDAKISARVAISKRAERLAALRTRLARITAENISEEALDKLEDAL